MFASVLISVGLVHWISALPPPMFFPDFERKVATACRIGGYIIGETYYDISICLKICMENSLCAGVEYTPSGRYAGSCQVKGYGCRICTSGDDTIFYESQFNLIDSSQRICPTDRKTTVGIVAQTSTRPIIRTTHFLTTPTTSFQTTTTTTAVATTASTRPTNAAFTTNSTQFTSTSMTHPDTTTTKPAVVQTNTVLFQVKVGQRCVGGSAIGKVQDDLELCKELCRQSQTCYGINYNRYAAGCVARDNNCQLQDDPSAEFYLRMVTTFPARAMVLGTGNDYQIIKSKECVNGSKIGEEQTDLESCRQHCDIIQSCKGINVDEKKGLCHIQSENCKILATDSTIDFYLKKSTPS